MNVLAEFVHAFLKDSKARHKTVNLFAFILNICYIYFNLISGILYENILSVTAAAYYIITVFVRYLVIGDIYSPNTPKSAEAAKTAAYLLFILSFPITGIIVYILNTGTVKKYPLWILSVFAVYSVFSVIRSALGLKESLKTKSATMRVAYSARLSAALMSLFNFQTSLTASLLSHLPILQRLNFSVGIAVSAGVFMLAFRALRRN